MYPTRREQSGIDPYHRRLGNRRHILSLRSRGGYSRDNDNDRDDDSYDTNSNDDGGNDDSSSDD